MTIPFQLVLALVGFCGGLSMRLLDPMVPEVARDVLVAPGAIALLATAFSFTYAIGQPFLGPMGDAWGKLRVIRGCIAAQAATLVLAGIATSYDVLGVARVLGGLASGGIIPLGLALIGDRFALGERQVVISRFIAISIIAQMSGVLVAGVVGAWLGWRAVFLLAAIVTFLALVATFLGGAAAGEQRPGFDLARVRDNYRRVFANPRTPICYSAVFCEGLAVFGASPYIALLLEQRLAGGIQEAGFALAGLGVGGVLFAVVVRRLYARFRFVELMRGGGVLAGLGLLVIGLAPSWPLMLLAYIPVGFGFYMMHNGLQTQATELAPEARGAALALHAFFFFVGQAMGPIAYGLGLKWIGAPATFLAGGLVLVGLGFFLASRLAPRTG